MENLLGRGHGGEDRFGWSRQDIPSLQTVPIERGVQARTPLLRICRSRSLEAVHIRRHTADKRREDRRVC